MSFKNHSNLRACWLPAACAFGLLVFPTLSAATPFVVPNGARQVEQNSGTNIQLSGPCGPVSELNQPVRGAFYQGNGLRGGLSFEFSGAQVRGRGEIAVDIDLNQTVQTDPSFILGGSFSATGVSANGAAVGSGRGSGTVAQGGFIFTFTGTQAAPQQGKVETLSMSINDFGGISGCVLSLNNFTIEFLIPVAAGTIGATTPTAAAVLPNLQYQEVVRGVTGIRRVISAALPGLHSLRASADGSGDTALAASEGMMLLGGGGVRYQGLSAGGGTPLSWGVWANLELSFFEDDFAATAYDADRNAIMLGADVSPRENMILGLAVMYSKTDVDSFYNGGGADIDTLSVMPYLAMSLSEDLKLDYDLSVNFIGGYGDLDISQFRTLAGTRISSSPSGRRWFASGDMSASRDINDFTLTGTAGLLYARDRIEGFTESNGSTLPASTVSLGQFHIDGEAAYNIGRFTPFASLSYEYDFQHEDLVTAGPAQPANDSDGFRVGLGLRFYADDTWTGSLRWDRTLGRQDFDEDSFGLQIHGSF